MHLKVVGILTTVFAACILSGPLHAQDQTKETPKDGSSISALSIGDSNFDPNQPIKGNFQLSVNVSSAAGPEQDLSGVFQVDPTGSVQMKLVGSVQLKGLTATQSADKIAGMLKPYIKDPKVTVSILSVPKAVVFFSGAVLRAGATAINDNTSLAELLTVVGFSDNADLSKVRIIHRNELGARSSTNLNFIRWLKPDPGQEPDEAMNPVLTDKDFVFVPLKTLPGLGNVIVEGDVLKPGVMPLRLGVPTTLREVISMSGGVSPTADRRQVSVRRLGMEREFIVDYDKLEAGDPVNNITVAPDDIVYIQKLAIDKFVNLNGAFMKSGKLPYQQPITLTQAIAEGGGLSPLAKEKEGRIYRHAYGADPTRTQIIAFDYNKMRKNKQPDIMLEPGDTIEVPIGVGPRPALDPFQITSSLLSIALLVDRLFSGRSY